MSRYTPNKPQQEWQSLPSQPSSPYPPQSPPQSQWGAPPPSYPVPPPPQWQQQPYGQLPQKPPRKKRSRRFWITVGIIVLIMGLIGGIINATGNGKPSTTSTTSQATQPAPTPKPTQPPKPTPTPTIHLYKVGEQVVTGGYTITFESTEKVKDSYMIEHGYGSASKPGEYYLAVTTTVHTPADGVRHPLLRSQLTLTDLQGNPMKSMTLSSSGGNPAPDVDAALLGIFVVKSNVDSYILTYTPLVSGADPAMWKVDAHDSFK